MLDIRRIWNHGVCCLVVGSALACGGGGGESATPADAATPPAETELQSMLRRLNEMEAVIRKDASRPAASPDLGGALPAAAAPESPALEGGGARGDAHVVVEATIARL